ncbi:CinA family protein [Cumulibacter manganitolerans]|uniref:CinA family protein n=1 Tax=Cumulibacter manganitolerans TaxID=1884992 RepID=UPI001E62FDD6|nr:CinA family protein [Cumulibacter manganitolerans]
MLSAAKKVAERLRERGESVAVAESSSAGLIAAALLAQPGSSAYFVGGAVVYTRVAGAELLGLTASDLTGMRSSSEPYAFALADRVRSRLGATWGIGETGAAGPTGNRYGDAPGHSCLSVVGTTERSRAMETGSDDREANMQAFAVAALELLGEALGD